MNFLDLCIDNLTQNAIIIVTRIVFSCFGGKMDTKYKLNLSKSYSINSLASAVVTSLTAEYLIDIIRDELKKYSAKQDLTNFMDRFAELIDESYDVSFSNMEYWLDKKSSTNSDMLKLVVDLDKTLTDKKVISERDIVNEIQDKFNHFVVSLADLIINEDFIDCSRVDLKKEYINSTLEQLRLLDEGVVLSSLMEMQLEFTPLDTKQDKNKFIEKKLSTINRIARNVETTFDTNYGKLLEQITGMYDKFYGICYSDLTDGEKAEKARKVIKEINPYRLVLDDLENKLSKANELKRQLAIHKKHLLENLETKNSEYQNSNADDEAKELIKASLDSASAVSDSYLSQIEYSVDRINDIEKRITEHYKVLDMLENALKTAVPSEEELKRYSAVIFKVQELLVKLEQNKTQMTKDEKKLKYTNKTAKTGLQAILTYAKEIKDIFMRNAMVVAIFRAVDALEDFATDQNKAIRLKNMQNLTTKISKFNDLQKDFNNDLVTYRRISNDLIRDISITLGKGVNEDSMLSVVDLINTNLTQLQKLSESLQDNNSKQIEVLSSILPDEE